MGTHGFALIAASVILFGLVSEKLEDTVVVIDCPVDYAENMKLTEKLGQLHVKI